jgi:CRP-like cAMP-binding protein
MGLTSSDIKNHNYFSSLSDNAVEELALKFSTLNFPAGSFITKEGDEGDFFYFVKEGRLEILKKGQVSNAVYLSTIGSGRGFGEISLLTYAARSTTVRAVTDVILYRLAKADFESIISGEPAFRNRLLQNVRDYTRYNRIKMLQPFELLEPEKIYVAIEKMTEKTYMPGEDLIVQGEKGDNYYIIKSGRVAVLKKKKGEAGNNKVVELGGGDAFGEEAIIRDDPRSATCRAMEETVVFILNKKDFNQIVISSFLDNIFPEEIDLATYLDDYVIIDARIPAEYEEAHICGAVNIPVEILREKCNGFDPSKKYITYCLNDARGMVGAFLLKNRGFNAQCLRGGVSSWLGKLASSSK